MFSHKKQFGSTACRLKSGISKADINYSMMLLITSLIFFQNLIEKFICSFYLYMKMANLSPTATAQKATKRPEAGRVSVKYHRIYTVRSTTVARLETWCCDIPHFLSLQKLSCDCKGHQTSWFIYSTMHK